MNASAKFVYVKVIVHPKIKKASFSQNSFIFFYRFYMYNVKKTVILWENTFILWFISGSTCWTFLFLLFILLKKNKNIKLHKKWQKPCNFTGKAVILRFISDSLLFLQIFLFGKKP